MYVIGPFGTYVGGLIGTYVVGHIGMYVIGPFGTYVVASFPGLPHFYRPFAFTIIHRSGRPAKMGKAWEHLSREWT